VTASSLNRFWMLVFILLVFIILAGSIVAWLRYSPSQPLEISIPPAQELQGKIHLGGAVSSPGIYSFSSGDSVGALIQAAGGTSANANLNGLKLHIPILGEEQDSQKVDINRAEVWLLEALPGIGETLAQRIVDYRQQNGPFLNTNQIAKVAGIGSATYEQIKNLITVAD